MLGFLFKILLITAVVGGIGGYIVLRKGGVSLSNLSHLSLKVPIDTQVLGTFKDNLNPSSLGQNLSQALDSLVTHPDRNSPVVLGVKATNESVGLITDTLMNLPNDKLDQIKQVLCSTPSAR